MEAFVGKKKFLFFQGRTNKGKFHISRFGNSGKPAGHDLDVLFSYPERDDGDFSLIAGVRDELDKRGLVIWSRTTKEDEPNPIEMDSSPPSTSTHDRLPLCMLILKYPLNQPFQEFDKRDFSGS